MGISHAPRSCEPIAIIGMGCRFPGGANSPAEFWRLLAHGVDAISEVPSDRWDAERFYDPDLRRPGKAVTRWGGFVDQPIDRFDALFFGMSPREAEHLDPMHAWLLEVAWEALEDAAQVPAGLAGSRTGVFIGVFTEDVKLFQLSAANRDLIGPHTGTGTAMTMAANRLSFWFDFRGPSVALDTACSSSLVALHLACQSLRSGECELALAGGANAMFKPEYTIAESKAGMLSPDGRCKTFDRGANGYVRGEGAGIVVLKPLAAARADGDPIHAVVLSTAVNQDGHTSGITVPNGEAQEALLLDAVRQAGISPGQVRYVEAHGTGTPVGDPIEARALGRTLALDRPSGDRCSIGSVKTNIGHLEAAAGVAGVIKVALCLENRQIPPHLHLHEPNPEIPFDELCLRVPRSLEPWPDGTGPALSAVNSFGFGGTNAIAVLAEAPPAEEQAPPPPERPELITISARSREALNDLAAAWRQRLADGSEEPLADVAATAALRRSHHDHRLGLVAASAAELDERLAAFLAGEERPGLAAGRARPGGKVAFVYSGMGPQWWAMGRQLLAEEPVFRTAIERCDGLLGRHARWSLLAELTADEAASRMAETRVSQPANFALQVALTELLRAWGVAPDAIVGHSTGEAAAMWASGVLSLEEATRVIHHRSRLQHLTTGQGRLVAVESTLAEAEALVAGWDGVSIAAVNSPATVTLSGDPAVLEQVVAPLGERGVFHRFLRVEVPFHSHYMDPLRGELLEVLADLDARPAAVALYSTVTGARAQGRELDADYWWRNVRETVRFAAAIASMAADGYEVFIEIGPHPVLSGSISECLAHGGHRGEVLATLRRHTDERERMLGVLATLYTLGAPADWQTLHPAPRRPVALPLYPWQRQCHWEESSDSRRDRIGRRDHPLLGDRLDAARPTWEICLDAPSAGFLADHRIEGAVVYPGAAWVELGLAALRRAAGGGEGILELADVRFDKALFLSETERVKLQVVADPESREFAVFSHPAGEEGPWQRHAGGRLMRFRPAGASGARGASVDLAALRERLDETEAGGALFYERLAEHGFHYGALFQNLDRLWARGDETLAHLVPRPELAGALADYELHPALLDACFQAWIGGAAVRGQLDHIYLPVSIERLVVHRRPLGELWVHARATLDERSIAGGLRAYDDEGRLVFEIAGMRLISLTARQQMAAGPLAALFYETRWQPVEAGDEAEPATGAALAGDGEGGVWLLFAGGGGLAEELAVRLEMRGELPILVHPTATFEAASDRRSFGVDAEQPEHFRRLLAEAFAGRPPCRGLVHLWNLDAPASGGLTADALMAAQSAGPVALLHLVQAIEASGWSRSPKLWVVTRGAQAADDGRARLAVAQSPVWGFARTIFHQEYPELAGGLIDLDPARPAGESDELFDLVTRPGADEQLALRGGARRTQRLVPVPELADGVLAPLFRREATYLVTGGLSGLGLCFSRWMVERGARRLILMGRSALPKRDAWSEVDPLSRAGERIAAIRGLEAMGASVHPAVLDVADEAALTAFLDHFRRQGWPPLRGVIHAAGVAQPRLLPRMDAEELRWALAPKLAGGWLLDRLLDGETLDFFVVFSSVAGLGFSMGMANYAAGNAFLDALAHDRRARGLPALSIDWGGWGEIGMAGDAEGARDFERRGIVPIAPEQGLTAMARLLERDLPQVTCIGADWPTLGRTNYPTAEPPRLLQPVMTQAVAEDAAAAAADEAGILDRLARLEAADERLAMLEDHLLERVSGVLRLDPSRLDRQQRLSFLGLDSMMAVELRTRIDADLHTSPSVVELLQDANLTSLAELLLPRLSLAGAGDDVAELAAELGELPDDELQALLER